jgi:hypothetical protein
MVKQRFEKKHFYKGTSFSSEILKMILKIKKIKTVND